MLVSLGARASRGTEECDHCAVRAQAICGALAADGIDRLGQLGRKRAIPRGQTLVWEGDPALLVANVIEGVLKLSISSGDGREQIVGIAYPSDFIGRPFGGPSSHSVTALTDARLCLFSRSEFDAFAAENPVIARELLKRALGELDRARSFLALVGRKSAAARVATLLLDMAERFGGDAFDLPIGRQQIADLLGLTIETVSRQLARMKASGLVGIPGGRSILIADRPGLEALADAA